MFNTIRTIDSSKVAVDFDTFSKSIMHGNAADQDKLKKLQGFCENEHGFSVDTLFSMERRKLLLATIMDENKARHDEVDNIWNKAVPYEVKVTELRQLDDAHTEAVVEHDAYIAELQEALQLNKKDRMLKDAARAKDIEILNQLKAKSEAERNSLPWLFQSKKKDATPTSDTFRRSTPGERKLPLMANSKSTSYLNVTSGAKVSSGTIVGGLKRDPSFS